MDRRWWSLAALLAIGVAQTLPASGHTDNALGGRLHALAAGTAGRAQENPGESARFTVRLSDGASEARPTPPPPAVAASLSESESQTLLDRLPPLTPAAGDDQPFALGPASLPPPRPGRTIVESFPPPAARPAPDVSVVGPLTIVRHAPDGNVPLAPNVSLTFSHPMVELTSHDALAARAAPVKLTPQPPGEWRWLGTRTVVFETGSRLPMATDFQIDVPEGTAAVTTARLARAERFRFSTPPPTIVSSWPKDETAPHDPVMFAAFDQRIDPAAVLRTISVNAGSRAVRLRLATSDEIARTEPVRRLSRAAEAGRWLAFRTEERLPADAAVVVTVGPGTPSAEGPKTTTAAQEWRFRTFGALRVTRQRCGWNNECRPFNPWIFELSNGIDTSRFADELVRVEPPLPNFKVAVYGTTVNISGQSKGNTTYRVTLASGLADVYGQTLGTDYTTTLTVGSAMPLLTAPSGPFVVLDPAASPRFSVYSINHPTLSVRAYAVTPGDWAAYQKAIESRWNNQAMTMPGRQVMSTSLPIKDQPDEVVETAIDLGPALKNGLGHVVLVVDPPVVTNQNRSQRIITWIQATHIGLDAFVDDRDLVGWTSSLDDGRPLAGVELSLDRTTVASDAQGLGRLALPDEGATVLVARLGDDVAMLPRSTNWYRVNGWSRTSKPDAVRWYVADDRHLYRPGEDVKVKGWLRVIGAGPRGDVQRLGAGVGSVMWRLRDARQNEIANGTATINALGGFDLALKLPPTMNLGGAALLLQVKGSEWTHGFRVEEFRRPEFAVTSETGEGPHMVRGHAMVTVAAKYYAGGPLPNADVAWRVRTTRGSFTPPNRRDFTFGTWVPWWEYDGHFDRPEIENFAGQTDSAGRHVLRIDFDGGGRPRATNVHAEASVQDVNRQAWTSASNLLVHPASVYVGLKTDRYFVERGQPLPVDLVVADLEGKAVAGRPVEVRAERLDWKQQRSEWKEVAVARQDCAVTSSAETSRCTFTAKEGGTYRITARVIDAEGRANETEIRRWVAGGRVRPSETVAKQQVTLIPNKEQYRAGDTAEILVVPPFAPAEGLLTLRRSGLLRTERFTIAGDSHTLRIPVEEGWTPNVHVEVSLVGSALRTDANGEPDPRQPKRPAFASGSLKLTVPPAERTLNLQVVPRARTLEPGGRTSLDVTLRDSGGRPVAGGEVAVYVVDEAVLSLSGYRVPDPLAIFYQERSPDVYDHHLRSSVVLGKMEDFSPGVPGAVAESVVVTAASEVMFRTAVPVMAPAMLDKAESVERQPDPIRARTDFNPLALFAAALPTDANGRAQVTVTLPDNLTRYRVMAVAVAGATQFGSGESTITARLPLMVRPSPPRFLNFGDRAELPLVIQNQTDAPLAVDVAVRATNASLTAGTGRRVTIGANDRAEVRFPMSAGRAGTARFQVVAASGRWSDASQFAFPIWTPATTEAFATYGQIDSGAVLQKVLAPPDAVKEFGGLQITTSSTALQALTDAVIYLVNYPFECGEQVSSRILAIAALRDVLSAFGAPGLPSEKDLGEAVARDLDRLAGLQNSDGGFALWRRGDESWPYVSVHAAHAFQRAKEKGLKPPAAALDRSRTYLREIERHIPSWYGEQARQTLIAYALFVRQLMADPDPTRARQLVRQASVSKLSFEALGWLLVVLSGDRDSGAEVAAIRTHLNNHVTETAGAAHFAVSYGDSAHLLFESNRRADAVVLNALIVDQPKSDLIPKIVEGFLAHRTAGRWENTQENVFILLALDRYFRTYERVTPDFVARAWLGGAFAGEHDFRGRTTERHLVEVPMQALAGTTASSDLVIAKDGPGRLYYRVGLRYAPANLDLQPMDRGFVVTRVYSAVDDPGDVSRDASGTWHVKAGARVRVTLSMVAPSRRYHVALVDPLPAGFEALNPALKTTGSIPSQPPGTASAADAGGRVGTSRSDARWYWSRPWFEHQNLRDDRVEAFTSLLWEGVWTYTYVARATTPGQFVVPPAHAEEMYHPETFGRDATARVIVEERSRPIR